MKASIAAAMMVFAVAATPAMAQGNSAADTKAMQNADAMTKKTVDAIVKKDAAAMANLFTTNAVFALPDGSSVKGRAAIQKTEADTFAAWGTFTFTARLKEVGSLGPRSFWALSDASIDGNGPKGPVKIRSHVLGVYVLVGKDWKIAAESIGANVTPPGM